MEITKGLIISFLRQALPKVTGDPPAYQALLVKTLQLMAEAGILEKQRDGNYYGVVQRLPSENPNLSIELTAAYEELRFRGIVVPNPSLPNRPDPNWYRVTSYGREWMTGSDPVPEDREGLLRITKELIPAMDPVIEQYFGEALITFERQAWFAAAVMVGAAAEKTVYLLIEALRGAVQDAQEKKELEAALEKRGLPKLFDMMRKKLDSLKKRDSIPYAIYEGCDQHLLSLFEAVRVQRNEAVHPVVGAVTPPTVRLALSVFPFACRKAYDLINWLKTNSV